MKNYRNYERKVRVVAISLCTRPTWRYQSLRNKYLCNTPLVIDSYRHSCNQKCWHVTSRPFNTFQSRNNNLSAPSNEGCCWYINLTTQAHTWTSKHSWNLSEMFYVATKILAWRFNKKNNKKVRHRITSFRSRRSNIYFHLGLALQHQLSVCRNLILLIIYFLVGCQIYVNQYELSHRIDTCAGSTIKIVFNTYLSNNVAPSIGAESRAKRLETLGETLIPRRLFAFHASSFFMRFIGTPCRAKSCEKFRKLKRNFVWWKTKRKINKIGARELENGSKQSKHTKVPASD